MSQNVESEISKIDDFLKQLGGGGQASSSSSSKETVSKTATTSPSGPYPVQTVTGNPLIPHTSLGLHPTSHPKPPTNPIGRDPSQQPNLQLVNYSSSSDSSTSSSEDSASTEDLLSDGSDGELEEGSGGIVGKETREEGQTRKKNFGPRVKGEIGPEDLPDIETLSLEVPEGSELKECGKVTSLVDDLIIVQGLNGSEALDMDTVLWNEKKQPIGKIFEVFGPVKLPFYSIRKSKDSDLDALGIPVGTSVYFVPDNTAMTSYVFAGKTPVRNQKGSDASWMDDIEPPEDCLDYSDDEAERSARRKLQSKRKTGSGDGQQEGSGMQAVKIENETHPKRSHHHSHKKHHHKGRKHHHHPQPQGQPVQTTYTGQYSHGFPGQTQPSVYSTDPRMQVYFQTPPVDLLTGPLSPEPVSSPVFNSHSVFKSVPTSPPAHSSNPILHQNYFPIGSGPMYHPSPPMLGAGLVIGAPQQGSYFSHSMLPGQPRGQMHQTRLPGQQVHDGPPIIRPSHPLRAPIVPVTRPANQNPPPKQPEFEETDI